MKWLVLLLLAANVLVWFAGDFWVPDRMQMVATAQNLPRVSTLKVGVGVPNSGAVALDSESDSDTDAEREMEDKVPAEQAPEPVLQLCVRLGWFETSDKAREAYRSLGSPGANYAVLEQERTLEPLHWVIIPPQPEDRALRMFNDLQRRGIDSYLVTRGENRNAISLGLFQSKEAAERVLETKKSQNLNAVLANFPRNQLSYALVFEVSPVSDVDAGDRRARDYQDDFEMVEISRCEGIATTTENP